MKISLTTLIPLILLTGCLEREAALIEQDNKVMECTDTRDGEVFTYETDNVKDISSSGILGDISITVIDNDGNERVLKKEMEAYLKCKALEPSNQTAPKSNNDK